MGHTKKTLKKKRIFETIIGDLKAESNKEILFVLEKRSYKCSGGLVTNWWAVGVQEVVDAPDEAGALGWISQTDFVDQLDNDQLQNVAEVLDLLDARAEKVQGPILVSVDQHHERITFAWHVLKLNQKKFRFFPRGSKLGKTNFIRLVYCETRTQNCTTEEANNIVRHFWTLKNPTHVNF